MTILRERVVWTRELREKPKTAKPGLTSEEMKNVRRAFRYLRVQHCGGRRLAIALGLSEKIVEHAMSRHRKQSAALALCVARFLAINIEEILSGRWPEKPCCPHCGRT